QGILHREPRAWAVIRRAVPCPRRLAMHASRAMAAQPWSATSSPASMPPQSDNQASRGPPAAESRSEVETKKAIRELLAVLPQDILDELNNGQIDLKDTAF